MPGQFKCRHTNCHRSYNRKEHLVRHEKSHQDIRPFRCQSCGADFYRSDLLKRHVRLSATCGASLTQGQTHSAKSPDRESRSLQPVDTPDNAPRAASVVREEVYQGLGQNVTAVAGREELERLYFSQLHQHWPLLDKDSFLNVSQPSQLVAVVLVGGLWMVPNRDARREARRQHDILMQEVVKELLNELPQTIDSLTPSEARLPYFQALLIPFILFTYRGYEQFPDMIMSNRHLFDVFQRAGIYQQERIDQCCSSADVRQQYQKLALLHFKVFMHYDCLFRAQLPAVRAFDWFKPGILQVRAPSSGTRSAAADNHQRDQDGILISDLLDRSPVGEVSQATIAALIAWDFSLGMIFACFITQKKEEDSDTVMQRIKPNLFLHLVGWDNDPGDSLSSLIENIV